MTKDDLRYYETFYGIHTNHLPAKFGAFPETHFKRLVKDYISEGCTTEDSSSATDINEFLYPHHIKKKYFVEGIISGQITLAANTVTCSVTSFRVTLCKVHENTNKDELFTSGWIVVNDTLTYADNIGEERVYYFEMDAWEKAELGEKERLYVKVEVNADADTILMHSVIPKWEDLKIEVPFLL